MRLNKNYFIAGTIFFLLVITLIILGIDITGGDDNLNCQWEAEMDAVSFKGIVQSKFLDEKNHMSPTIVLMDSNEQKIALPNEKSGIFEYIEIDDYIEKSKKSLLVKVVRDSSEVRKKLDYGCVE